ncbi:hypothetical protein [Nitrosomonas halophila]|uniref:hypothetical protein n=1 Tax=Nitrosomonas halophila TaxID=44576 RepID=UPI0015A11A3A|nr:hypothetical protein [Nitrosomonas halophila]
MHHKYLCKQPVRAEMAGVPMVLDGHGPAGLAKTVVGLGQRPFCAALLGGCPGID